MAVKHVELGVSPTSKIVQLDISDNSLCASIDFSINTFTPPKGFLWKITSMTLAVDHPTGATVGYHSFALHNSPCIVMEGGSTFDTELKWDWSTWRFANHTQLPATNEAQLLALLGSIYSYDNPLYIIYMNGTDIGTTEPRVMRIRIVETAI